MSSATTSTPTITTSEPANITALRSRVRGKVITSQDPGYEEARFVHVLNYNQRPAAFVQPVDTVDVAEAVRFAREFGLPLAVRSGGHSVPGLSLRNGIITIDLSSMKAVSIDPETKIARVQAGCTSADLANPAQEMGLALSTGDTSSVGLGGLVTGGGVGLMARKFGLSIDNLLSATVVTADGQIRTASPEKNPDLFWAIRGGGGNFGIITEFEFQLAEVGTILGGMIILPATRETVRTAIDYMDRAPDGLTVLADITGAPPMPFLAEEHYGKRVLMLLCTWAGDLEEGEKAVAPLRSIVEPLADTVAPMPYASIYDYTDELTHAHGVAIRQMFTDGLSDESIDAILEASDAAPAPICLVEIRAMGGAVSRVPADATAFAHRDQKYFVFAVGVSPEQGSAEVLAPYQSWVCDLWKKIEGEGRGAYVNFLQDTGEAAINRAYPPETLNRLREVKAKYDPDNTFRFNQNILPA